MQGYQSLSIFPLAWSAPCPKDIFCVTPVAAESRLFIWSARLTSVQRQGNATDPNQLRAADELKQGASAVQIAELLRDGGML